MTKKAAAGKAVIHSMEKMQRLLNLKAQRLLSAVKFKKKIEARAQDACYLRRKDHDFYQIWMPENNKVTSTWIYDFILQQKVQEEIRNTCKNKA